MSKKIISSYITNVTSFAQKPFSLLTWWTAAIISFAIARMLQFWLDGFYARSEFPVPYYVGQLTFDATQLKSYYQVLLDKGTLDLFFQTQLVDYAFMAGSFVSLFFLTAACYQTLKRQISNPTLLKIALVFCWISPLASIMDAFENAVSFIMIADPVNFADWLVYPYSGFALCKFIIFMSLYCWVLVSVVISFMAAIVRTITNTRKITPKSS